jgi:signal transduction histidine kinase/CheY-like chemotaxis protein
MEQPTNVLPGDSALERENEGLRRQIRDLLALMGLPALWIGRDAAAMAEILADVLLSALHVAIVYVQLDDPAHGNRVEVARGPAGPLTGEDAAAVRAALDAALAAGSERSLSMADPRGSGTLAAAVVHLRGSHNMGAVLTASHSAEYPSRHERLLLNAAGNQLVFALRERQLLGEEARLLETVNRVGRVLAGELDLQKLMQALTDAATEISHAQFGAFFYNVAANEGEAYQLYTLSGAPREAFAGMGMPRNTDIFHPTFSGERTVRFDDVTRAPEYGRNPPYHGMPEGHLPVRSYLAVPVVSRAGEVLGGLFFGHGQPGVFTEREEKLVTSLAAQAAIAIDNARLFERSHRLYAEAQEASRLKDEFLATLSHELRTPLNAIVGWVHLLRAGGLGADTTARALEVIARNAEAQNQLIADMLDISRIVSGRLRLELSAVDLVHVVSAALDTVRPSADVKGVRVESALEVAEVPVSGDAGRLQQVVWNLLSNAIKFTGRGGTVKVDLELTAADARLTVTDSGIGIRPDFLPHVFELFRQGDSSSTRTHGGLGLGLAIVRHLVELHGGTVQAWSAGVGQGARFTVELPVRRADTRPAAGPETAPPGALYGDLAGVRILLVEDDADSRDLTATVLEQAGALVTPVADAAAAMDTLLRTEPDVLVSDIELPGQDGYQLIRRVRALPLAAHRDIPALALTAYAGAQDASRAVEAGFQLHVPKPFQPRELVDVLARVVNARVRRR